MSRRVPLRQLKYWILAGIVATTGWLTCQRHLILDYVLKDSPVSESQLIRFSEIFLREYVRLVEHRFEEPYRRYFESYSEKPYEVWITKSNSKGAAVTFIPSDTPKYCYRSTDLQIEAAIFPSRTLSEDERSIKMLESVLNCVPNHPCFVVTAPDITFEGLEFIASGKQWIEVIEEGTVTTKNIVVNKVSYPNLTKMKASTLRKGWSVNEGKREARELFESELWFAFQASEDFRQYLAYPELEEIVIHILENWRSNPDYTMFDFKKDVERLYLTAILKYNVQSRFVEGIFKYLKERYTLKKELLGIKYTDNWFYTAMCVLILVVISSLLVLSNFPFKVYRATGFRPLLKNLKKRADYFFPLVVCFILYQERPSNASLFQWIAPWIIAGVCVYIIYRLEMKFHSSSDVS